MFNLQRRTNEWTIACFSKVVAMDTVERNHRFLEEALELVQATGCTASEAHQLVDYVFNRPVGQVKQEVGGALLTLMALCNAIKVDLERAGEKELDRVWEKFDDIREKQQNKPAIGPLAM